MADNRIYLACETCGDLLYLGKRFGAGYYWYNYGKENNQKFGDRPDYVKQDDRPLEDRLNEFYEKHQICGNTADPFTIAYEMDDDFCDKFPLKRRELNDKI